MAVPHGNQNARKNKPPPPKYKFCQCGNKLNYKNKSGLCHTCKHKLAKELAKENQYFKNIEVNRSISFAATPQKIEQWLNA